MKTGGGDRHQPRRPHLPCRDRRARARHPGGGRRGARDRALRDGAEVTVSCAEGDVGSVYAGALAFEVDRPSISQRCSSVPRPRSWSTSATRISPSRPASCRVDGVGLARMEFIISEAIKVHPMALIHPERIEDPAERAEDRAPHRGLRAPGRLLRREALRRRGHDRGGLPSEAGDRAHVGLQDQRVRGAARRTRLRAAAKPTRCSASAAPPATRTRPTRRASRSNARPCGACARRWGSRTSRS